MSNSPAAAPTSADKLAADLAAEMPPVSPGIADSLSAAGNAGQGNHTAGAVPGGAAPAQDDKFKYGKKADGSPRAKPGVKPGSKSASKAASRVVVPPVSNEAAQSSTATPPPTAAPDRCMAPAIATAQCVFKLGRILGGEEWNPIVNVDLGLDEPAMMIDAWLQYYRAKGVVDIPPGVMLSLTLVSYVSLRFSMPQTQTRFQRVKHWLGSKFLAWKARRAGSASSSPAAVPSPAAIPS